MKSPKSIKKRIKEILRNRKISGNNSIHQKELKKLKKQLKTVQEVGQAQMAGPSGPQYDTTGNQRLEHRHVNIGNWNSIIKESVEILINKEPTEETIHDQCGTPECCGSCDTAVTPEIKNTPVVETSDIDNLKFLAGIKNNKTVNSGSNISLTAEEKVKLMKENNIKPGTPEWFKLWFSLPYLTGEKPV